MLEYLLNRDNYILKTTNIITTIDFFYMYINKSNLKSFYEINLSNGFNEAIAPRI